MKVSALIALALPSLLAGCASGPSAEEQAAMAADARKASGALIQKLGGELKAALSEKGPEAAISVCKERAPQVAADVSKQSGFDVKRVSPKNRNPAGVPDAWEAEAQAGLEKRHGSRRKAGDARYLADRQHARRQAVPLRQGIAGGSRCA